MTRGSGWRRSARSEFRKKTAQITTMRTRTPATIANIGPRPLEPGAEARLAGAGAPVGASPRAGAVDGATYARVSLLAPHDGQVQAVVSGRMWKRAPQEPHATRCHAVPQLMQV